MRISDGMEQWTWGTPLWMAPEVLRGERPTPASDVWSLGCTVIEMVTGAQPWQDSGPDALLRIGFSDEVPKFPDHLSKIGRDFLDKCLRRDATERWTGEQLLQHPFLADDDMTTTGPSPRSVLDLANSEFPDDDDSSEENSLSSSGYGMDSGEVMDRGRGRVRELALDRTVVRWESNGWEMVRSAEEPSSVGEWSGSDGEASRGWLSDGTRCSASTCCCCCCCSCLYYCSCCKRALGFHHGGGVSLAFVLGWFASLLHMVLVNAIRIPFYFHPVIHTFIFFPLH